MPFDHLADTLAKLPASPGVYLMKGEDGTVLYVGKAASLRSRVRSYFQPSAKPHGTLIAMMLPRVHSIEILHANSAVDALILENNLVKQYQPRYNIKLKDDKRYPYIRLTVREPFPMLSVTRNTERDGSRYFGPFVHARATRETLKVLTKAFPVRTCALELSAIGNDYRVCLDHHLGRCPGPCADLVTVEDYAPLVQGVMMFLSGKTDRLLESLEKRMADAARSLDFEAAARLRDQIRDIRQATELQRLDSAAGQDYDVIGTAIRDGLACAQVLMVRDGKLVEREHFFLTDVEGEETSSVVAAFVAQYYADASFVPSTIVLIEPVEMQDTLSEWLTQKRGARVTIHVAQRGQKREMAGLAQRNAATILEQRAANVVYSAGERPELRELMEIMNLDTIPHRIEAYDISNFGGDIIVGSMVVFEDGEPAKSEYRRFRVKDVQGPDDYAAMRQVIFRRFTRGIQEGTPMPDVILIDGGKGQLNAASEGLADADYARQPRFGVAKRYEHLFLPDAADAIILRKDHPTLHLVQRIRDEAHRFAVSYLRRLRDRRMNTSILDEIPSIGDRRKRALLSHFGDVESIRHASLDDLLSVKSITRPVAQRIFKHLHSHRD
ncbi:excinuclease ABC subunit UvrC [Candidatus Poribacteria bacterium]|nr:excinuclease ABC subunit UvrC [Candidatus Poribacteria bacterium]